MSAVQPDKICKARTEHECSLCGLRIRKRATYVYRAGVDGNRHWKMRMHPVCEDATRRWGLEDWETGCDAVDFRWHELYLRRGTVLNIVAEILGVSR